MKRDKQQAKLEKIRDLFPFKSRYIKLSHKQGDERRVSTIHYIDEGKGEPIVFVHGNPTWAFYFRKVISKLKTNHRCIAFDHLGCGLSEKNETLKYRLEDRCDLLKSLLDELKIEKCHLVVHDWGGAIGMGFATRHPEHIASVTVTNTAAFVSEWISWRINICRLPIIGRFINYHLNGFLRAAMYMTTKAPLDSRVKRGYLLPYKNLKSRESIDQFVKDIPMKETHPSFNYLKETGEKLSVFEDSKILILWGMRDFCFSPYFLEIWTKLFKKSKVVAFEDADHFLFEEKSVECAEEIKQHVSLNHIE